MSEDNRPLSEIYGDAAEDWVAKESAAHLLEETKSAVMSQRQAALGDIPVNRAEQIVKASAEWYEHIEKIVESRRIANLARVRLEFLKMKFQEWQSSEANERTMAKL